MSQPPHEIRLFNKGTMATSTASTASTASTSSTASTASASTTAPLTAPARSPGAARGASRLFNPLALLVAGTPLFPLYGVIQHRGRRTGKVFRTPVVVRKTNDGFAVPLPWGERTDWCRNVRAAGGCTIRWKGRDYPLERPQVVNDSRTALTFFNPFQRALMSRFGIKRSLHLHHPSAPVDPANPSGPTSPSGPTDGSHGSESPEP